jgi:hypothetical protein
MVGDDVDWFEDTAAIVDEYAEVLVGFDEEAAEACVDDAGLAWRVVARDGEHFAVTEDYRPERVNVVIDKSVVMETSAG